MLLAEILIDNGQSDAAVRLLNADLTHYDTKTELGKV